MQTIDSTALSLVSPITQYAAEIEPSMTLSYYTLHIPYAAGVPTVWHPTSPVGPFSVLTRGVFKTPEEAHEWAAQRLVGTAYRVEFIEAPMWTCMDELAA